MGWAYDTGYYCELVNKFVKEYGREWKVFVFSDDITWCKENQEVLGLNNFTNTVFIERNVQGKNYIDMQLMSSCKGDINMLMGKH